MNMLAPSPVDESGVDDDDMLPVPLFPRGIRWRKDVVGMKSRAHKLILLRNFMTELCASDVNWDLWESSAYISPDGFSEVKTLSNHRLLLDGLWSKRWYLSERVSRQVVGGTRFSS